MLIIGQNKDVIVNLDSIDTIKINDRNEIVYYNGTGSSEGLLGKYATKENAKTVLKFMWTKYMNCNNSSIKNAIYEMPEYVPDKKAQEKENK